MAYVAKSPESYEGNVVGTGHCVPFVQEASGAPLTSRWKRGKPVKGELRLAKGTAIARFDADGSYTNRTDGTAHAAIYVSQSKWGINVWDQWKYRSQPVHQRTIRFQFKLPLA